MHTLPKHRRFRDWWARNRDVVYGSVGFLALVTVTGLIEGMQQ